MKEKLLQQFYGFRNTPPLWTGFLMGLQQFEVPEVRFPPTFDITTIIPSLNSTFVLGKRMECFLELLIKLSHHHQFIAGNLQVRDEKITLGEIDFLAKDLLLKKVLHIEMVYKFYVYDPTISIEMERWIGPNRRDSLLKKLNKLEKKQLPLLFQPETIKLLTALNINLQNLQQVVCFKAQLFLPRGFKAEKIGIVNSNCIAGIYINQTEFSAEEFTRYSYYSPKKQDWPIEPEKNVTWYSHSDILREITLLLEQKRSALLWMRKEENSFERFFVVWW